MVMRTYLNVMLCIHDCLVVSEDTNDAVLGPVFRNIRALGRLNFISCSFLAASFLVNQIAFVGFLIITLRKTLTLVEI
jgi:hypothetical protein